MKQFLVIFETRKNGAIGIFENRAEHVTMRQSSFSENEVIREAMQQLHAKGFETRFAVEVRDYAAEMEE
jgi:hypothetical protein